MAINVRGAARRIRSRMTTVDTMCLKSFWYMSEALQTIKTVHAAKEVDG